MRSKPRTAQAWSTDPVLSADGTQVAFVCYSQNRPRRLEVLDIASGARRTILERKEGALFLEDWSDDGRFMAVTFAGPGADQAVVMNVETPDDRRPFAQGARADEYAFSPSGRWLAYAAVEDDRWDVFITHNPPTGERWRVQPRWEPGRDRLFFLDPDGRAMVMNADGSDAGAFPQPRARFDTGLDKPSPHIAAFAVVAGGGLIIRRDVPPVHEQPIHVVMGLL